jgi:Uma2 family endonuclease
METASKSAGLTVQDLRRLPDDGLRHELIDGEHYVTPAPRPQHQRVSGQVFGHLFMYLREHPVGWVYHAPLDVLFGESDCVEPDLLVVSRERERRWMTEDNLEGAPDLVVEILSPSTKHVDRGVKHRLYERFRVPEYWIIDPESELVMVYRLDDERLLLHAELSRREGTSVPVLSTPLLPGFELSLDEIFK